LKKLAVDYITSHHGLSRRRACRLVNQCRANEYYKSRKDRREDLRSRMRDIANTRVRYGYRRIHVLLMSMATEISPSGGADDFLDYLRE